MRGAYRALSDVVGERWTASLHAGTVVKGLYLRWTLAPLLARRPGVALDVGCGSHARFARLLARRWPAWRFVALDLDVEAVEPRPANLSLCAGDLRALPVRGPVDLVYAVDVLEHVEDAEGALVALARCLRPGGALFLHVPASEERNFLPGVDRDYSWLGPPGPGDVHVWPGFDRAQIDGWLSRAGLEILVSRATFGAPVAVLKELFMLGEARRIPGVGLALLPLLVLAAWLERRWGGRRGNALLVLARRRDR